ncbi:MAG TPA: restriction endonuclease subunit S, partial [Eubacterium sp.]|nr:restriction endonuclease subunit S [Eubacterium sp.]
TAELTARKQQYEFYRDYLLNGNSDYDICNLGDVCDVVAGGTPSRKESDYWEDGCIPWLGSTVCKNKKSVDEPTEFITELGLEKSSAKMMKKDTTLIALVGATIGKVAFTTFDAAINQNIAGVYPKDTSKINPSYIYYACTTLYPHFLNLTQGSKLAMANLTFVRGLKISVPPIDVQNRLVNVLDNFESITSDLSIGLPAEIEARKKQYEYYRDALLTYASTGKIIARQTDRQTD